MRCNRWRLHWVLQPVRFVMILKANPVIPGLEGNVTLVTGAGRGLGSGIAKAFLRAGVKVCATDVDEAEMEASFKGMKVSGNQLLNLPLDVTDPEMFDNVVHKVVDEWGRLDVLVHAAVIMPVISFEKTSHAAWWHEVFINLGGLFNGTKAVWEVMKAQGGGHIMSVASLSSFHGFANEVAYCVGKHGQEGFAKSLSIEAVPHNIAINAVGPGKRIKPSGVTVAEAELVPEDVKSTWTDPTELGQAYVWLASQPPNRFTGLCFNAGKIVDTMATEGWEFDFAPEKVTSDPEGMKSRWEWYTQQSGRGY